MSEEEKQEEQVEEKQEEQQVETPKEETPKEPDKYDELVNQVKTLTENFTQFQSTLQTPQPKQEKTEEVPTEDQFWSDPMGQINKIMETKMKGILAPVADTLFETQKENIRSKYKDFSKYEAEIDQFIKMAPEARNQAGAVEKLYKMVKGLHSDDLEAELRQKIEQEHNDKTAGSLEGGSPPSEKKSTRVVLTAEEKSIAHKMMPEYTAEKAEEEYAKWKN